MNSVDKHLSTLLQAIRAEEKTQRERYKLDQTHTLKSLKAEGLAIHPISITRKQFGYADYPEFSFRIPYPAETNSFRDGCSITCFCEGEESIKGVLMQLEGRQGEVRLYAPDFPDWLEDGQTGIMLSPDDRTLQLMSDILEQLPGDKIMYPLFQKIHGENSQQKELHLDAKILPQVRIPLNESQLQAVTAIQQNQEIVIVHGPPGTGKSTTLTAAIDVLVREGKKVLVAAPSNTAVDHLAAKLLALDIRIVRVGNTGKVNEAIFPYTPEGKLSDPKIKKEIKALRIRADEFRRMALSYKRSFGKAEREQRNLLFKEVKQIRQEIRNLQQYHEDKLREEAQVILGTPVALHDMKGKRDQKYDTLMIDEAGQCLEPLAWCIFPMAERYVLAGDPFQLPPTVLSPEASKLGLSVSILEQSFRHMPNIFLLNTQYRMRENIAGFSSRWFYENRLQTAPHLQVAGKHLIFYDTAGYDAPEERGQDGSSLQNAAELRLLQQIITVENLPPGERAFISPYAGQVLLAKEHLGQMRISTIDSFQGQEAETIFLSLVRSNDGGDIGFLKDYRRMNVAITRAKQAMIVIGDSSTLARDPFYDAFIQYIQTHGEYKSVWELEV